MYDSTKDTIQHIENVQKIMNTLINSLHTRAEQHDKTKLEKPEKPIFDKYTSRLAGSTYGSNEYETFLSEMKPALDHHYSANRHHPEHFQNGILDMNLVDLVEMLSDWKAATMRHNDGDIMKSLEINQQRFGYSDELKQIFINTVYQYFN